MSGHFVLKSIGASDQAIGIMKGARWSEIQHSPHPGWNAVTRNTLSQALQDQDIGDRNLLPPHRYLEFSPGRYNTVAEHDEAERYLRGAGWADSLIRPSHMDLTNLSANAAAAWGNGVHSTRPNDALAEQFRHGAASVEIYYVGGEEIA